jgi:hypothetical protein
LLCRVYPSTDRVGGRGADRFGTGGIGTRALNHRDISAFDQFAALGLCLRHGVGVLVATTVNALLSLCRKAQQANTTPNPNNSSHFHNQPSVKHGGKTLHRSPGNTLFPASFPHKKRDGQWRPFLCDFRFAKTNRKK